MAKAGRFVAYFGFRWQDHLFARLNARQKYPLDGGEKERVSRQQVLIILELGRKK